MRRNRRRRFPDSQPPRRGEPDLPALTELERFTEASLHQWLAAKANLDALQRALYFQLEPLRQRNVGRLLDALLSQTHPSLSFDGWSRIVDYRYGLEPLSGAGSLKGAGGRFNIGSELSPGTFTAFPALYIAEDYEAAFRERFAGPTGGRPTNFRRRNSHCAHPVLSPRFTFVAASKICKRLSIPVLPH